MNRMTIDTKSQWLHNLLRDKRKLDNLSMTIAYQDKQLESYRIKSEEGSLEEHHQIYYHATKVKQKENKRNNEIYQERYHTAMEKYVKDGILTEEMVKDLVDHSRLLQRIQREITELCGEREELDEEQKEKMYPIQGKYDCIYGMSPLSLLH